MRDLEKLLQSMEMWMYLVNTGCSLDRTMKYFCEYNVGLAKAVLHIWISKNVGFMVIKVYVANVDLHTIPSFLSNLYHISNVFFNYKTDLQTIKSQAARQNFIYLMIKLYIFS